MFTIFLKELGGYFDRYWLLSVFFPSLAFWTACLFVFSLVVGLNTMLQAWASQTALMQTLIMAAGLSWVALFAYLLGNFQTGIIRFFEGYWEAFPLSVLRRLRLRYHRRRFRYLKHRAELLTKQTAQRRQTLSIATDAKREATLQEILELRQIERERLLFLPYEEDKVMPTRLGNIIRAAELYPLGRYGIDAVVTWPRLHALLPAEFIENILGAKTSMTFMLMLSVLSFAFASIACLLLGLFTSQWLLFLICAFAIPLSWLCYRNAVYASRLYAELIKTAFDLHRWKLLEALHLKRPTSYEEETRIWEDVTHLIYRGEPLTLDYEGTPPAPETEGGFVDTLLTSALKNFSVKTKNETPVAVNEEVVPAPLPPQPTVFTETVRPRDRLPLLCFIVYLVIFGSGALLTGRRAPPQVNIPVAATDLPAYHFVTQQDLQWVSRASGAMPQGVLRDAKDIVGRYTLQPIMKNNAISSAQLKLLVKPEMLASTVVVAIPATQAMTLGGSLKAGDTVDIRPVASTNATTPIQATQTFENILVLDIKPATLSTTSAENAVAHSFVMILALPASRQNDFAVSIAGAQILVTRRP